VFLRSQGDSSLSVHCTRTNDESCLEVLIRLRESGRRKRAPELRPDKWILHHNDAPAHDVLKVREFLAKKSIMKMDHPPYSPT
jgi:hypothetical protein